MASLFLYAALLLPAAVAEACGCGDPPTEFCRAFGNDECCKESGECGVGEGHCTSDAECADGLECRSDSCPWGDHDACT